MNYFAVAPLDDLAVIEVTGADSTRFLQGQLTHDVASLDGAQARLAGYCTAKGRLLASMVVWNAPSPDNPVFYMLVKADIAEALVKRLSMYVLRAKVKFEIAKSSVSGISIQAGSSAGADCLPAHPDRGAIVRSDKGVYIAAPSADAAVDRWWFTPTGPGPYDAAEKHADDAQAQWQIADIMAGLPWVAAATQDIFIPQTLNLDLIDGISFDKGCYPGQEVVARSHYRGKVKRRMAYGLISVPLTQPAAGLAGVDIFDEKRPDNACGRVVNAAQAGQTHVLIEVQLADLGAARFKLGQPDGPSIVLQALPYDIDASA